MMQRATRRGAGDPVEARQLAGGQGPAAAARDGRWPASCRAARASPRWRSPSCWASRARRCAARSCGSSRKACSRPCPTAAMRCALSPSATWPTRSSCAARSKAWRRGSRPSAARRRWCCARRAPACERIDELLREPALDDAAFSRYVAFNEQFHRLLSEMAGSPLIAQQLERVDQPAVRLALGLRGGAGQLAGRARHAA